MSESTASTWTGRGFLPVTQAAATYPEWIEPQPGSPIRQGDVLIATGSVSDRWHEALVIITADCDIANTKHAGSLSCVPVLQLSDYLLQFRFDRLRDGIVRRHITSALKLLSNGSSTSSSLSISAERMREWVAEEEVDSIIQALSATSVAPGLADHLRSTRNLVTWAPSTVKDAISALAEARTVLSDFKTIEKAQASISAEVAKMLDDLPGDALYLNEISAEHSLGFVAYLRRLVEISDQEVAVTQFRLNPEVRYVRASRLRAPYIYALTQQFAAVFSAIGLPTMYEDGRGLAADAIRNGEL